MKSAYHKQQDMLFEKIFINNLPLMDVRAPVEFAKGSFPTASNLPIMTDAERHEVGICYKQQGKQAAIQLGESFYTETVKKHRQQKWLDFINTHPEGYLFCLRGGLRSHLTQQLIQEAGGDYPLIPGGFKAMRNYLTRTLKSLCERMQFVVIGGLTGSGKTRLLNEIPASIDLENMANHKGSAFGKEASPQPTQINFEHQIAIRLLQLNQLGFQTIYIEDEGRHIGRVTLPQTLQLAMASAPVWQLTAITDQRIKTTIEDYVLSLYKQYSHLEKDQATHHLSQ
ncbi:MAG: tRNA 2-selenouridine(34) synthase MnmH, partial [bacterium]